jgi:hypothetical protein
VGNVTPQALARPLGASFRVYRSEILHYLDAFGVSAAAVLDAISIRHTP